MLERCLSMGLVLVCSAIALESIAETPAGTCTRLPGPPDFPLPTLARDLVVDETHWLQLGSAATNEAYLVSRDLRGHWLISRADYTGDETLRTEIVLDLAPLDPEESIADMKSGDFDGDGRGDLVIVRDVWPVWPLPIDLFLGREDGTLEDGIRIDFAARDAPLIEVGDYDGDDRDELVAFRGGMNLLWLYEFNRQDGWTVRSTKVIRGLDMVTGDVDADGRDDLIVSSYDWVSRRWAVHLGDSDAPLSREELSARDVHPGMLTWIGRKGENGQLVFEDARKPRRLLALTYSSTDELGAAWEKNLSATLSGIVDARDVDHDGLLDLIADVDASERNDGPADGGFAILPGRASGPLGEAFETGAPGRLVDSRDLDGDGTLDLVIRRSATWTRYRGLGDMSFDVGRTISTLPSGLSHEFTTHDLDDDGISDVLALIDGRPWWMRGRGDGTFDEIALTAPGSGSASVLRIDDIDRDGYSDVALITSGDSENGDHLAVAWGEGGGRLSPWSETPLPAGPQIAFFADFDGNGHRDLFVVHSLPSPTGLQKRTALYLGSARSFSFADGFEVPRWTPDDFAAGDFHGERKDDLLYLQRENPGEERYRVMIRSWNIDHFGDPLQAFEDEIDFASGTRSMVVDDLDGDGHNDLAFEAGCTAQHGSVVRTLKGSGAGAFHRLWLGSLEGAKDTCVRVSFADIDRDGVLDAVERRSSTAKPAGGPFQIWRGDGMGGFLPAVGDHVGALGFSGLLPGRFADSFGRDMIHLLRVGAGSTLSVTRQMIDPLDEDIAPPTAAVVLSPDLNDAFDPPTFERRWRLGARIEDECGPARADDLQVVFTDFGRVTPSFFKRSDEEIWRVYIDPDSGETSVVLRGPQERKTLLRYMRARREGGIAVEPNALLELLTRDGYGPTARAVGDDDVISADLRLIASYGFKEDKLDSVFIRRPDADIDFYLRAIDHLGKTTEARSTFHEQRDSYCQAPKADAYVCE